MNANTITALIAAAVMGQPIASAAGQLNPLDYIRQHGWEPYNAAHVARSPNPDVAPLLYYVDNDSMPSCGLLTSVPGARAPKFTELMQASKGEDFPQCVNVVSIVPFRLDSKEYLSVEYVVRDTREDLYRNFAYLYRDPKNGYVSGSTAPKSATIEARRISSMSASPATWLDGIKLARADYLKQAHPRWQFHDRDFISDEGSSFSLFDDRKAKQCYVVTESGGKPVVASATDYSAGAQCSGIVASSRLEKRGMVYYIGLLKLSTGAQLAVLTSVAPTGEIRIEKDLAAHIDRSGATQNIKSIKAILR